MLIDNLKQPRTTQVQIHLDYDIYIHSIQGTKLAIEEISEIKSYLRSSDSVV